MITAKKFLWLPFLVVACAAPPEPVPDTQPHLGIRWVRDSAEYVAVATQVYRTAENALPGMVADQDWSALPYQRDAAHLPPAVILDIDQTSLTNPVFQAYIWREPPFTEERLNDWSAAHDATPTPGINAYAEKAKRHDVNLFFVTNRECRPNAESSEPCPQKAVVIQDLLEAGLPASAENVFLAAEREGWGKEKRARFEWIAENYRVIQLIGDDLGDFIPCVRRRPVEPCTVGATIDNRFEATAEYGDYWGAGWYILPNPMHGSWTSVR